MGSVLYLNPHGRRASQKSGTQLHQEALGRSSPVPGTSAQSILRLGYNCCAVARAERLGVMIDAESYFRAFQQAALKAQRSITILAWDFNSQTRLHFEEVPEGGPPALLGDFLNYLCRRRRALHINVLNWDYPMVFGTDREFPPIYGFGWTPHRRVHLRYDDTHPIAGCHHQKIVVIDECLAFSGGIDLTVRRWDTSAHLSDDPRRVAYGKPYPPFHDLMVAVDGEAARALGAIARERWLHATGQRLKSGVPRHAADPWPASIAPDFIDTDVGIARTMPPRGDAPAVREVERLYLDMIAAARGLIYIENQYFTAPRIAAALAERLAEPDGPEIVLVLRLLSHGWLEEHTMHVLRSRLIRKLKEADRHGRFHAYYPHIPGLPDTCCLDVHSKLMIVDDRLLRIGSANLCNRSMNVDTEADVIIESRGLADVAEKIRNFRDGLLAEHLDVPRDAVQRQLAESRSMHRTIAALGSDARSLRTFDELPEWPEAIVSVAAVADPDEPISFEGLTLERDQPAQSQPSGPAWGKLALLALAVAGLTAMWRYTPLAQFVTAEAVIDWAKAFANRPWAPLVMMLAYTPACFIMFPRPLITLAGVIAFGAVGGFFLALGGIVFSAIVTFYVGKKMKRDTVRRLAGPKLDQMVEVLRKHGLLAMTLLRLVPLAPFAVEGIVAGAVSLKLRHLAIGTAIGMLPGTLVATVFGNQIETALTGSGEINWWLVGGCAGLLAAGVWYVRRWFGKMAAAGTSANAAPGYQPR